MAIGKPRATKIVSLNAQLDETRNLESLCKKIVRFTRWRHHWPTAGDLHRKHNKGPEAYTLGAIKHYFEVGMARGWLEKMPTSAVRLTEAYYLHSNTIPLEPELSSSASARAKQKTFLSKTWTAVRKLKKAGLWPEEDEYDKYDRQHHQQSDAYGPGEDIGGDYGDDWRTSPFSGPVDGERDSALPISRRKQPSDDDN